MIVQTRQPLAQTGLYDHAMYPFVTMPLYPIEGSICGYSIIDIGKDTQIQIDLLNKSIIENALEGASPRYFVRDDGTINLDEYKDKSRKFVRIEQGIGEDYIRPIESKPLGGIYVNYLQQKIDELKYVTSNQDVNNGTAPTGITAASAIAALQETSGKNARSTNKAFHRAYRDVCYHVVELIRQFYDAPRTFRINPDGMQEEYIQYSNAGLKPQQMMTMGMVTGLRLPEFDISVSSEKANPYKRMEMNELAMAFYNAGFFNVQMSDQALACLNMMDFEQKDEVMQKISENGTLYEKLLLYQQMALQLAGRISPQVQEEVANSILQGGTQPIPENIGLTGEVGNVSDKEHPYVEKARSQARESTQAD